MKTKLLALLCALTLLLSAVPSAAALEGEAARAADILSTLHVLEDTDYALEAPATRAQAAVLLVNLSGQKAEANNPIWYAGFRDVPEWAFRAVHYAGWKDWVSGFTVTEFRPNETITANAWFAFLLRMLGYSDQTGDFTVSEAAVFAQRIGLASRSYTGPLSRSDLFQSAADALTFSYKDGSGTVIEKLISSGTCTKAAANALGLLDEKLTAREIADRKMSAVFCLHGYKSDWGYLNDKPSSNASGFFITSDGVAVTNYHSIEDSSFASVTLSTGDRYYVDRVLWYSQEMDLAVLKVSQTSFDGRQTSAFAHLELAGTTDIRAGDPVYTLGNPLALGLAVSSGIISDIARNVERYAQPCVMNTADISEGSSGGALLNEYGRVVAVTSGAYAYGNNMYLAVPVDPVMSLDLTVPGKTVMEVYAERHNS